MRSVNANGNASAGNSESATSGAFTSASHDAHADTESVGDVSSLVLNMPSGSGGKLTAFVASDASPTLTMTGWTKIGQDDQFGAATMAVFEKTAAGGDTGTVSSTGTQTMCARVVRTTGASTVSGSLTTGTGTAGDPPNHSIGSTQTGVAYAAVANDDGNDTASSIPSGYTAVGSALGNTSGGDTGCALHVARIDFSSVSSVNPGTFTIGNEQWVSGTVTVY